MFMENVQHCKGSMFQKWTTLETVALIFLFCKGIKRSDEHANLDHARPKQEKEEFVKQAVPELGSVSHPCM